MPSTYTLISSNVLGSPAASITFSAIPGTYTDLVLRISARTDRASQNNSFIGIKPFNSDTASNYSTTRIYGDGSTVQSGLSSSANYAAIAYIPATTATGSTFGSVEVYIPSYTASQNKAFSSDAAHENNATLAYRSAFASLWRNTDAITSITIDTLAQGNFISGSSFYLYGIKNS
jgi:hypothetical protein